MTTIESTQPGLRIAWTNAIIILLFHLTAAFSVVYMATIQFSWWTLGLGVFWYLMCGMAITAGYHRLFSHGSYKANAFVRAIWLLYGAAAVQNSVLRWAADHRLHHARVDQDEDPYNIRKGFWWAHIGWVVCKVTRPEINLVRDLHADPLVRLQDRYYVPLAILMGAVVPFCLGLLWGDPFGAMLFAGFLRLAVQWHATFSINSLAHKLGTQPYCKKTSARDSFWTSLLTMGEGYHNFHHRFKNDYRNGVRWYHYDPTKWLVWTMSKVGMAHGLRRVAAEKLENVRRSIRSLPAPTPERTPEPAQSR